MLSRKAMKKLAHQILAMSFNYETESTYAILTGMGIDATEEDADAITGLVAEMCAKHEQYAKGFLDLVPKRDDDK